MVASDEGEAAITVVPAPSLGAHRLHRRLSELDRRLDSFGDAEVTQKEEETGLHDVIDPAKRDEPIRHAGGGDSGGRANVDCGLPTLRVGADSGIVAGGNNAVAATAAMLGACEACNAASVIAAPGAAAAPARVAVGDDAMGEL
jgi:hypothetical protein